ncbi:MAG: hypothetical protein K2J15_06045, partial [Muribaculaceae bacterium]|nr:hypothetical protein [Muribaculaceae bacterium]
MIPAIAASLAWAPALAQNHSGLSSGNPRDSFQEFRKGLLSDFKDFRERLLDQYADFLNGEWHEYESLRGEVRDRTPKPKVVPSVTPAGPSEESPSKPPISLSSPVASDQPSPATIRKPENHGTPKITDSDLSEEFTFYGLPVSIPRIDFNIKQKLTGTQDFGAAWSKLKDDGKALRTVDALKKIAREMNLNDYLLFRLTESYVNSKFPGADASARFSLIHYLLANMGYDIRIAVTSSGRPLLIIPFKEMGYSRTYMN